MQVEVWSDIACPWCFIGKTRFAAALEQFDRRDRVDVIWRSYQLSPEAPVGARERELDALVRMKGMAPEQVAGMFEHVASIAKADGLTIDFDTVVAANTFDAHRLVHIARKQGLADEILSALFEAHFSDGRVVDDRDVLVELAERAGVTGAADALAGDAGLDEVRADLATARELQVTGVPFFVAGRRIAVSGAQPVPVLLQLLEQGFDAMRE
ncbi:DsbA family oxidoreductase [Rhodococcus sp. BP-252]|nr:DsbA family oxidoreductase [Rhodococcus sp. B10]MBY6413238.1 DsbA family oxidoreductase [Rhodococcus sp. BP-320]MBY6418717.1 DsbA family oxidoreductase [Rhodococcus sp. BP-321]MBY6423011.1 DsbA family oxidoreductase [Rhodococcus sp. BP-324]MBY6427981.1 DsbA family oxidoreductase [Rhodococcus sp. BP-323]MBY6433159.1 DsbA family oxidoreductase [Rhodococcus sp. BP-322]MBY6442087.1 DsbA family oxidoreductase [Rhodococcus sp. BP-319]MBY6446955.1 DsbA family oxidoreductase [Rhodococcus sp. BP-3